MFIIYILRTSIDLRSRQYSVETMTDTDNADDLALLTNTSAQAKSLLHSLEQATGGIDFYVNANKSVRNFQIRRSYLHFDRPLKFVN